MDKNKLRLLGLTTALVGLEFRNTGGKEIIIIDDDIFGDVKLKDMHKTESKIVDPQVLPDMQRIDFTPAIPPIPKGCKEYAFDIHGEFSKDGYPKMLRVDVVFKCIALNDKSAIRKFKNRK